MKKLNVFIFLLSGLLMVQCTPGVPLQGDYLDFSFDGGEWEMSSMDVSFVGEMAMVPLTLTTQDIAGREIRIYIPNMDQGTYDFSMTQGDAMVQYEIENVENPGGSNLIYFAESGVLDIEKSNERIIRGSFSFQLIEPGNMNSPMHQVTEGVFKWDRTD
ncbi:MAG TPA: hypothetical protein DCE41_33870 [Cytophagales bacterium]|nr:hypothetical protein [Cytophagales bacterium]HAA17983.1 hypothetical protein [Cytophagales bacterium]HAP64728.1 hypothetical protein [Cytophagales bacterium]